MSVPQVVFDCNVYVQALISPDGPAAACVTAGQRGEVTVFISETVLSEIEDVAERPYLVQRFKISDRKLQEFMTRIRAFAQIVDTVPHVFTYDRDPKDEHYIDLAIATNSELVVSRDRDLLALADPLDPAGQDFMARYPSIRIVTPVDLVARLGRS